MMADMCGGYLKLMYLSVIENIDKIGSYSWGSATLAYLYHFLCKASQSTQNEIAGFLPLLQVYLMIVHIIYLYFFQFVSVVLLEDEIF